MQKSLLFYVFYFIKEKPQEFSVVEEILHIVDWTDHALLNWEELKIRMIHFHKMHAIEVFLNWIFMIISF